MTDRLQQIRDRFDAIIPGPWRWYGNTATDQVMLATTDRGRLFIMSPAIRTTEYVFDHDAGESYELTRARERVIDWCGAHGAGSDPRFREDLCACDALHEFLRGELAPEEGHREYVGRRSLTRGVQVHSDLRFPTRIPPPKGVDADRDRKQFGGIMRSYRGMAKYEVLGHCTKEEFERRQQLIDADQRSPARDFRPTADQALYREDFIGIDQPEAIFIEHAPEDIGWLLDELEVAHKALERSYHRFADLAERLEGDL